MELSHSSLLDAVGPFLLSEVFHSRREWADGSPPHPLPALRQPKEHLPEVWAWDQFGVVGDLRDDVAVLCRLPCKFLRSLRGGRRRSHKII
jgi:hypothetical protein